MNGVLEKTRSPLLEKVEMGEREVEIVGAAELSQDKA